MTGFIISDSSLLNSFDSEEFDDSDVSDVLSSKFCDSVEILQKKTFRIKRECLLV